MYYININIKIYIYISSDIPPSFNNINMGTAHVCPHIIYIVSQIHLTMVPGTG